MIYEVKKNNFLTRSKNGVVAGVLSGLARHLNIDPVLLRLIWLLSVLFFGSGLFLYLFLAFLLPLEGEVEAYERPKVLGVCSRIGQNYGHEVALVRVFFAASFFLSFGVAFIVYCGLYFLLPEKGQYRYYRY